MNYSCSNNTINLDNKKSHLNVHGNNNTFLIKNCELVINVRRNAGNAYALSLAGAPIDLAELPGILRRIVERHGNTIPVVIRASQDAEYGKIDEIIAAIGSSGLYKVNLATENLNHPH